MNQRQVKFVVLGALVSALFGCSGDDDDQSNAQSCASVLDPAAEHYGQTYEEWAVKWVTWMGESKGSTMPPADTSGEYCREGQDPESQVFFLAGSFSSGPVTRACSIKATQALLIPLLNWSSDNGGVPESEQVDESTLQKAAENWFDGVVEEELSLEIDGCQMDNLERGKIGPAKYKYTVPPDDNLYSLFGIDFEGLVDPSFTVGYYALVAPLSKGQHTVRLRSRLKSEPSDFTQDVSYTLTVE